MLFDDFCGFGAEGPSLTFKPVTGEPVVVMTLPPDVDSHALATALNAACNSVLRIVKMFSDFRF